MESLHSGEAWKNGNLLMACNDSLSRAHKKYLEGGESSVRFHGANEYIALRYIPPVTNESIRHTAIVITHPILESGSANPYIAFKISEQVDTSNQRPLFRNLAVTTDGELYATDLGGLLLERLAIEERDDLIHKIRESVVSGIKAIH